MARKRAKKSGFGGNNCSSNESEDILVETNKINNHPPFFRMMAVMWLIQITLWYGLYYLWTKESSFPFLSIFVILLTALFTFLNFGFHLAANGAFFL